MLAQEATLARGPLLSDGTALGSLIDRKRRTVSLRLLSDPEIHQLELARLWARARIAVGHESEIPQPGDFVTRQIGDDSVIVVRLRDRQIEVLLNVCSHRGMQVCRSEAGNAAAFRCVYHGWTFGLDGSMRGAPFEKEMYPEGLDKASLGLRRARVGLFGGIVFANWDASAPSLEEYLGEFAWYLNVIFNRTSRSVECLGAPHRYIIPSNWKAAAEQFAGDGYHSVTLHRCLAELGFMKAQGNDSKSWGLHTVKVSTSQGHGIICLDLRDIYKAAAQASGLQLTALQKLTQTPPAGLPPEMVQEFAARFSEEELCVLADTPPSVGAVFPNLALIAFYVPMPDGTVAPSYGLHALVPRGVDRFEFMNWVFVEKGASSEYRERVKRASILSVGASGFIEQDDAEVWPAQQRSASGYIGRQSVMRYSAASPPRRPEGWVAGGLVYSGFGRDDNQWNWWARYFEYMTAGT